MAAYIAGIIDGEGSIFITKWRQRSDIRYYPRIVIVNTNRLLIDNLNKILGPLVSEISTHKRKNSKHKVCYQIRIGKLENILSLLKQILPFLCAKKQQAILTIEYLKNYNRKYGSAMEYDNRALEIFEQVTLLNKRGTS